MTILQCLCVSYCYVIGVPSNAKLSVVFLNTTRSQFIIIFLKFRTFVLVYNVIQQTNPAISHSPNLFTDLVSTKIYMYVYFTPKDEER